MPKEAKVGADGGGMDEQMEKMFIALVGAAIIIVETAFLLIGVQMFLKRDTCEGKYNAGWPSCNVLNYADKTFVPSDMLAMLSMGEETAAAAVGEGAADDGGGEAPGRRLADGRRAKNPYKHTVVKDRRARKIPQRRQKACIDAAAEVLRVPCEPAADAVASLQAQPTPVPLGGVAVGDCLWDGASAARVFYHSVSTEPADVLELRIGDAGPVALTPQHLVPLEAGALIPAEAAGATWAQPRHVAQVYTTTGRVQANGVVLSCYEHWSDFWTTLDARFLYHAFGASVVASRAYQWYFDAESQLLDPLVQLLL